ncbi:pentatricopeptide repeat-containing protein At4g04790, mitochondrial [Daucus carota subsp. sativus]|uniref:pentatricopeptide repeat-containing protein At4g04790, mitochondrial n=1 Tax=Daucus carota subsp. sativus TaxID=79200 RepID=UPI0007EF1216|nr:PREDICTED: pentatricopeptide repeat-containing protein At4g04790, mitochondrial-like [Daucus carota subsp. sativus]
MSASKATKLSSIFRSACAATTKLTLLPTKLDVQDIAASSRVSPRDSFSVSPFAHPTCSTLLPIDSSSLNLNSIDPLCDLTAENLRLDKAAAYTYEELTKELSEEISTILIEATKLDDTDELYSEEDYERLDKELNIPWFSSMSRGCTSLYRKELARERKQKWVFKGTQTSRFHRLVDMCANKMGSDNTIQVFGKLGRETGVKEFNALMRLCIDKARKTEDDEIVLRQIFKAYKILENMKERGFPVKEVTYGPLLVYLIDMGLDEEFHFFCDLIRDENSDSLSRLSYYEMLLWVGVNNEDKIKELLDNIATKDGEDRSRLQENYLLALSESDRKDEVLLLLNSIDITNVSSMNHITNIFRTLGRHSLDSIAKSFLQALKVHGVEAENISNYIYNYTVSMPNLVIGDIVLNINNMHTELEVAPSSAPYEKLIRQCCDSHKVHIALEIVDHILEAGLPLNVEIYLCILNSCDESCEYNLVHRIYALMCHYNVKPNNEIFRCMISLSVKMKDYDGAYGMIRNLEKINLIPTAGMYNAILSGHFREKNFSGALSVLKEMESAQVLPDSQTFSYLISNCSREEDITKYYEELKISGVQVTKHIFMALINAYASCGQLEKAKQVVLDKGVPVKNLNEIKSVLVSALAINGKVDDALGIYEELKQAKCNLEPKAVLSLIEHLQNEGDLNRLIELLEELQETDYWVNGCFRVVSYCVRHKFSNTAVDLLKKLRDEFQDDEMASEVLFDEVFCQVAEAEPVDLQIGLALLQAIKKELGLCPSRKSLDFLLTACAKAKDLQSCYSVWQEYETAGLPYNVLSFLRMYQALLALGDCKSARKMLRQIPTDDPHVCCVIDASQTAYGRRAPSSKVPTAKNKAEETVTKKTRKKSKKMKKKKDKQKLLLKEKDTGD